MLLLTTGRSGYGACPLPEHSEKTDADGEPIRSEAHRDVCTGNQYNCAEFFGQAILGPPESQWPTPNLYSVELRTLPGPGEIATRPGRVSYGTCLAAWGDYQAISQVVW